VPQHLTMEFKIEVNDKIITVNEGDSLLTALQSNGIKIPTLCHMNRFSPTGACRLCVVEVEGKRDLITSCSYPVEEGMKVKTNSQRVIQARKSLVELLLSNHPDDCLYCTRNGNCELQWLAAEMNVKERKFFGKKNTHHPDFSSTSIARDPAKCVLCSRCVRICEEVQLVTAIDFISRGNQTTVNSAFSKGLNVSSCINCGQCVQVCPTAALGDISHVEKVQAALGKESLEVVFQVSPSAVASFAVNLNMKAKDDPAGIIVSALRKCGASKVFDLGFAMDINILEEAKILINNLKDGDRTKRPVLSSCCPAWVRYAEEFRPEWISMLSDTKSAQQIMGALVKSYYAEQNGLEKENIYSVTVIPCTAKKFEASRKENTHKGISETDAVLTVRELFQLFRCYGLNIGQLQAETPDEPYNLSSVAAAEVGYTGGKAEAVAREAFKMLGGKTSDFKFTTPKNLAGKKETKVSVGGQQLGFAWVSSIKEADDYLAHLLEDDRQDIHYVEVMACLGGCAGGGGQPISRGFEKSIARKKMCMDMEKQNQLASASDNPIIASLQKNAKSSLEQPEGADWLKTGFKKA
jgi:iron-only hydrogenase group A